MHIPSSSVFPDTRKNVAIKKCFNITENGPKSTVDGSMSSKITTEASVLISHEDLRVSLDVLFLINSVTLAQVPTSPSQKLEPYAASSKHLYCAKRKDKTLMGIWVEAKRRTRLKRRQRQQQKEDTQQVNL
ncbi:hypothetical protein JEQ12_011879 [Ovis aries]|uniref:Uncharacterized protein n=1 Tax=Ovis aries TaxID=9940 RepID=A0A835ZNA1_SHEEP|nr:hypothetical protein JEQ12_011879 [Ovis aries]